MKNVLLPPCTGSFTWLMKVFKDIFSVRNAIKGVKQLHKSIGVVPTMGALHKGHFSLVNSSIEENDVTIATIFVNPIQFNNPEDLKNYPSTYDEDLAVLESLGCDIVFAPSNEEMYPNKPVLNFTFGEMEEIMEGAFRPGHFGGVSLVVMKLLHILQPTRAYFGQKDIQQYKIIEQMVNDTSLAVGLKMMPIVREKNGLALSSRNNSLTIAGKEIAPQIYSAIHLAAEAIKEGTANKDAIDIAKDHLLRFPEIKLEYLTLVNLKDLRVVESSFGANQLVLCFAGYVGAVRLIDNIIIDKKK